MLRPLLTCLFLLGMFWSVRASPASADCSGPEVEYFSEDSGRARTIELDRGDTLHVRGSNWGDNCYDTGPPPKGERALGKPVTGIEIVLVQSGSEVVVARGAAGDDYTFSVDATVPSSLEPGEARLIARWDESNSAFDATDQALVISDAAPGETSDRVAAFGPAGDAGAPDPGRESVRPSGASTGRSSPATPADRASEDTALQLAVIVVLAGFIGLTAAAVLRHKRAIR